MRSPDNPVVTGASGFIGASLVRHLGTHRSISLGTPQWRQTIEGTDFGGATVIHLAARVHDARAPAAAYEADNVEKTRTLAQAAADAGARRFVFASTVKVFGEESGERPFREGDPARPEDAYARSKWRAEEVLREIASRTGLSVAVVRIPLTYGPGAAGNLRELMRLADSPLWLPFGGIDNRRSIVHVEDLVEALLLAATHPAAPGRTWLAAHPASVSTSELVAAIRHGLQRPRRLFRVPVALLVALATLSGQGARVRRLVGSLEVDPGALIRELGWAPKVTLAAGIGDCLKAGAH